MVPTSRYPVSNLQPLASTSATKTFAALTTLLFAVTCTAQDSVQAQPQPQSPPDSQNSAQSQATSPPSTVTLPPGTTIALVLTHDVESRSMRRGDDIYAQITSPVNSGNQVVIPPGTFVQGKVDKLDVKRARAELHLQSMTITLPDGYAAPIAGPITLTSDEAYALADPSPRRTVGFMVLPAAGAGVGALIGHSVGQAPSEVTSNFPPGCTGGPPFCGSTTMPVFGTKTKDAIIGAGIGGAIGFVASLVLLTSSRSFFLPMGTPVEMVLQRPISWQRVQSADAGQPDARQSDAGASDAGGSDAGGSDAGGSGRPPVAPAQIVRRPALPPGADHATCYTPGTPGTPDTVVPGAPEPDGVPGPPTTVPGIPPTAGMSYPCP